MNKSRQYIPMKKHAFIIYFSVLALALGCSVSSSDAETENQNPKEKTEEIQAERLTIKGTAEYQLEIGYGTIFNLLVDSVTQGNLSDDSLSLVVVEASFSDKIINSNGRQLTFNFSLFQEGFEDNRMTESGVVDSNKIAWKLVDIE